MHRRSSSVGAFAVEAHFELATLNCRTATACCNGDPLAATPESATILSPLAAAAEAHAPLRPAASGSVRDAAQRQPKAQQKLKAQQQHQQQQQQQPQNTISTPSKRRGFSGGPRD
ncbi:uncharacterized protein PAN0_014d4986 [Moesziomyces antarcticus]|uniref:Uncharacterized protein n=2 Tax=Pseudozyma antarctica TaxID=84753 RepID=A0A5C3FWM4_PSEA2|nr:uncharacterized protein PAN0_014d4986 [Moesziomyces antarcticus]GAK66763.1 hypothetical protein PAN0_014d4986 [Moesziomyces antarcticus]SPO47809.1 uncharacterized protein PSANT_05497 [Moesziomyces antarcticus]